jgi:hypothetical protein
MEEKRTRKCSKCDKKLWEGNSLYINGNTACSSCFNNYTSQNIKEVIPNNEIITPSYYWKGGIDVIEFAKMHFPKEQVKGFLRINAMKYLVRYDEKGGVDDLEKAMNYTRMLKEMEELKELE